jgi:superfamily I DNA/RNA helicase
VVAALPRVAREAAARPGSVGLVVPDAWAARVASALREAEVPFGMLGDATDDDFEVPVELVPATLAKGLEFDHVVLVEPEAIVAGEADRVTGLRRLYVCLTRAVTSLVVLHHQALPGELGGRG